MPCTGALDSLTPLIIVNTCCFGLPRVPFLLLLLEVTTFSSLPPPSIPDILSCLRWNNQLQLPPSGHREGLSPPAVLCHLLVTGICSWGSTSINLGLSLGAPIGSLVGWYRPGLWATVFPSPPAKGALSLKVARAKGQRDREIEWHHLSLCIQLCLWPLYSWTSIFCFSCSALGTFVANEFWTTWTWSTVLSRCNWC